MPDSSPPQPPSRPPPSSSRDHARGGPSSFDVLASFQTIGALLLGILLFAVPLYLWRRPRSTAPSPPVDAGLVEAPRGAPPAASASVDAGSPPPVRLSDARVLECHDRGVHRTLADQCDHIQAFERAFGDAIVASHDCVPPDAGTGSIEYVADLSFTRRRSPVTLTLPRDGRSFQASKIVRDCAAGVRSRLGAFPVAPLPHAHARYKISLVATYGGTSAR